MAVLPVLTSIAIQFLGQSFFGYFGAKLSMLKHVRYDCDRFARRSWQCLCDRASRLFRIQCLSHVGRNQSGIGTVLERDYRVKKTRHFVARKMFPSYNHGMKTISNLSNEVLHRVSLTFLKKSCSRLVSKIVFFCF